MNTIQKFKRALLDMRDKGELDKILKYTEEDTEIVEHDIELINQLFLYGADYGADNVSIWPLLMTLKSADILKNAISYMVMYDGEDKLEIGDPE